MSAVVFEKAVLTYTFLVALEDMNLEELQRPVERNEELETMWLESEPVHEIPSIEEDPVFWARVAVDKLFHGILERTRPQGVIIDSTFVRKGTDADHVAVVRRKIDNGERSGYLVTIQLEITRPDFTRPYLTRPERLPFPGITWLTSQIRDEPYNGLSLLTMTAAQIPV